jgi:hypothetical protein
VRNVQSLPPCCAEAVSFEYRFAREAKLCPLLSFDSIWFASAFDVTRMCRTSRVWGVVNDDLFWS